MNVCDFILHLVEQEDGGLRVFTDGRPLSGEGEHRVSSQEFRALQDLADAPDDVEGGGPQVGGEAGERLFRALVDGEVRLRFREATRRAQAEAVVIRVIIEYDPRAATGAGRLPAIPWELMVDPERGRYLALDDGFMFARHLRGPGRDWAVPKKKLRILFSAACPRNAAPLDLKRELDEVRVRMRLAESSGHARLDELEFASWDGLGKSLRGAWQMDLPYHVWHHCGHGGFQENGTYTLALHALQSDVNSAAHHVEGRRIAEVVAEHRGLQLIVLNVCQAAEQHGLGTLLAALDVPAVIGFRSRVQDGTALGFAEALWRRLPTAPVDEAVHGVRRTLAATARGLGFANALLFLRSLGRPRLFELAPEGSGAGAAE